MTRRVLYFDRNALINLQNAKAISEDDRNRLRAAIRDGRLSLLLTITVVEETLAQASVDPKAAVADLRWIVDFSGQTRMVKPSGDLLNEYIRAYAHNRTPDPFSDMDLGRVFWQSPDDPELRRAVIQSRASREQFVRDNADAHQSLRLRNIAKDARRPFDEYYQAFAEDCAAGFARRAGVLAECENRGLADLLKIRVVQVATGITLSFLYGQMIERPGAQTQDIGDVHHVIAAGLADCFVTHDKRLTRLIRRIPGFSVAVCTLAELPARFSTHFRPV